jgi:hypothetical protein
MSKRAFKVADVVSDEAKRELEALRRGLVDSDSSVNAQNQEAENSSAKSQSNPQSNPSNSHVAGKELLYEAPSVVSITTMGVDGLIGIAVRVFNSELGPVPVRRLFNKHQIELEAGDWAMVAHIGADLRGLVTVYRCETVQIPGRALLRRVCLVGPDGKFYPQGSEAFVPEEVRGRLVIQAKKALNAALRELQNSRQFRPQPRQHQPRQPRRQYQYHRHNPHNPYDW